MSETETLPVVPIANDPVKVNKRVAQYVATRDAIKARNDAFDEEMKPLKALQDMLTGWLQSYLEQSGAENIKTDGGTVYSTTRYSASLADAEAFMKFVKTNEAYDLLDKKANVTACRDYVTEHGTLPPGVNMSAIKTVGVRRPSGK